METLRASLAVDRSSFFSGYPGPPEPGFAESWDRSDWLVRERERIPAAYGTPRLRTWLQHRKQADWVCLDTVEARSGIEARVALASLLAHDQEAVLPRGPDDLGEVSVASGAFDVRTHYFVVGNLALASSRLSGADGSEVEAGRAVQSELLRTGPVAEGLKITSDPPADQGIVRGERAILRVDGRQLGDFLKIFARNGELSADEDGLGVRATQSEDVQLLAVLADSKTELRAGALVIRVVAG